MKYLAALILGTTLALGAGCAASKTTARPAPKPKVAAAPIITADTAVTATVASYNAVGRFVVLNFPDGNLPKHGQVFFIYRAGLKVGEVKITGPEHDNTLDVADLISGDARVGDVVRDQ